jgi:hypothetical protein
VQKTKDQRAKERNMALVAFAAGTVLTVLLAYLGHDPVWFVPLVMLLLGGGLAVNYYRDRISGNLGATAVAIAAGGVVGVIYLFSLTAISDSLGYGPLVTSLPLPIWLSLLYLPGWVAGAYLGWWAEKRRRTKQSNRP